MNIQQLEYIVAIDEHRQFARAASHAFITQPTLSMMVQRLEEELGVKIFERSRQSITPTSEGKEIILHARKILSEIAVLKNFASEMRDEIKGVITIGIIPTLAPYLLPLFLKSFLQKYPLLQVRVKEMVTQEIITNLKARQLDIGLLATPLNEPQLHEHHLFFEEFFAYTSHHDKLAKKKYIAPEHIDLAQLWLLEEGHCFRNQVLNFCELKRKDAVADNLSYEAGSIETLINLVDKYEGVTIIPQFATYNLSAVQKKKIRVFTKPRPAREISLVTHKDFPRKKIVLALHQEIIKAIPFKKSEGKQAVVNIQ
jgi:LysR family transcriptional regulator, hydrogen peroxide-inducible genes activator